MNAELKAWIDSRPENVREVAMKYPPDTCYRDGGRGHYIIHSYEEQLDGTITLKVDHGSDSFNPGFRVFGFHPEQLVSCGCGQWEWPSKEQVDAHVQFIDALKTAGVFTIERKRQGAATDITHGSATATNSATKPPLPEIDDPASD